MTEAPDLDAVARAGAVPALRCAPRLQPDARGSRRRSPAWRVPEAVKAAVWQRDDYTCRFCGFRSLRYQEVLVGGGNARDPDQMGTVCMFCHQCQNLEMVGVMRSGVLLWLPEIAQADLNWMLREIYVAIVTPANGARARRALDALMARREPARRLLGTDDPAELARLLRDAEEDAQPPAGIRLMALDRRIVRYDEFEFNQFPQVLAYWRSIAGPYAWDSPAREAFAWLARLEQLLPGAEAEGGAAGPQAAAVGDPRAAADRAAVDGVTADGATADGASPARAAQAGEGGAPGADVDGSPRGPAGDPAPAATGVPGHPAGQGAEPAPTHARMSARLLRDAATFFVSIADQNPALDAQMTSNARVYRQVADLLDADPLQALTLPAGADGQGGDVPLAELGARLMRDAATFFEAVGEQNAPLREQMCSNAEVFRELAERLALAPLEVLAG